MLEPDARWRDNLAAFREHWRVDPEGYKRPWTWSTVVATMYVGPGVMVAGEIFVMQRDGLPLLAWGDDDATNLYHQRFHLWHWEKAHPTYRLDNLKTIMEIGGGYGAMAVVASRLGFTGDYYLVDFPEMVELQKRHLATRHIGCRVMEGRCPSPDLLISCYGLSEAPLATRDELMRDIHPKTFLFGIQPRWEGIDNDAYFHDWAQANFERQGTLWKHDGNYIVSSWGGG